MPVTETLMAVGSWSIQLAPNTPRQLIDAFQYFGHIVIATGRQDPRIAGDSLLTNSRFVGPVTGRNLHSLKQGQGPQLSGDGMATWLGTPSGVGNVIESPLSFTAASFGTVVNALLPPSMPAGTIHSIGSATYTGAFVWKTRRDALTSLCQQMTTGTADNQIVEWRANPNGTVDAGHISDLYVTTPTTAIVAKDDGVDMAMRGLPGVAQLNTDVKDYTDRVVVLASGSGTSTAVGVANASDIGATNPYVDLHGNTVVMTRMVSASSVSSANATAAAQAALAPYVTPRDQVQLSSQEYDIKGDLQVGDYTYVYDPDSGFVDFTQEITFRGMRINPQRLRVIELTWPIVAGMTVAYRDPSGTWYDLTDYVTWETGDTNVVVGGFNRSLVSTTEPVGARPQPDTTIPATPVFGAFSTTSYQGASDGKTKAQIQVNWATPTNTDGTTVTDGDHYEIQYRPDLGIYATNPSYNQLQTAGYTYNSLAALGGTYKGLIPQAVANWKVTFVAWGTNTLLIQELTPGVNYDFQIRAVDTATPPNNSAWSATTTTQAAVDTIPPPTPDAPTVAANMASVQISWDCGTSDGGTFNQAVDLHHIEVHGSYEPLFTPSNSTKLGNVIANVGNITGQIPVVASFTIPPGQPPAQSMYVKIVAVDVTGNKSQPSAAAGVTAVLWSNAYITDLSVSKLTAGTVTASVILGSTISTASSGGRVTLDGVADAFEVYDSGGNQISSWSPAGLTIYNGALLGTIKVNTATSGGISPVFTLDTGEGVSSHITSMYVVGGFSGFADFFHIDGPQSKSSMDSAQSGVSAIWGASNSTDGGSFSINYTSNTANASGQVFSAGGWTVLTRQIVGGEGTTITASNAVAGSVLQNDDGGTGIYPHFFHAGSVQLSTDANGNCNFAHGAGFTPIGGIISGNGGGSATMYQYAWIGGTPFGSANANVNVKSSAGANLANTFVNIYYVVWA